MQLVGVGFVLYNSATRTNFAPCVYTECVNKDETVKLDMHKMNSPFRVQTRGSCGCCPRWHGGTHCPSPPVTGSSPLHLLQPHRHTNVSCMKHSLIYLTKNVRKPLDKVLSLLHSRNVLYILVLRTHIITVFLIDLFKGHN